MELQAILEEVEQQFQLNKKDDLPDILEGINLIELFGLKKATKELISFVVSAFPGKVPIEYFIDLMNFRDEKLTKIVIEKLDTNTITLEQWKLLEKIAREDDDLDFLQEFFSKKVFEKKDNKPKWVKKFPKADIIPVPDNIPSTFEAVKLLMEKLSSQDLKEKLISSYSISTIIEKIQMLSPVKDIPMFNDISLFREFGPVNSSYSTSPQDKNHICEKYGGCRMFLCTEFEEDEEEIASSWFLDECEVCNNNIHCKSHALRMPLLHGGWKGCYCSFKCLKENISDEITALIVGRIKEQLKVIGIRDQLPDC
jgi:hypothetical protein